jgi:DNA-binding transcriptional ArsR family regulator
MSPARREGALRRTAPVFAALGDPTRLALVDRLSREGPLSIALLTEGTRVTRQAVTKHLRVLEGAGLVRGRRRGREQRFAVETRQLGEARELLGRIARHWDDALLHLEAHLAESP